jgi:hypothetical protein
MAVERSPGRSHGAIRAARMVGDHSMSQPVASRPVPAVEEFCLEVPGAIRLQLAAAGRGYAGRAKFPGLSGVARQSGVRSLCAAARAFRTPAAS